jgi:non-ribosomal peptide synthase protein (TIGR01720 family)
MELLAERELGYWRRTVASGVELRTDRAVSGGSRVGRYTGRLKGERTQELLRGINQVYQTEINDILLSALGWMLSGYQGRSEVVFGLEGHGREALMGQELDVSRTVGWFTNLYPVKLRVDREWGWGETIRSVKEQLRGVPQKGMGYGVLRYLHGSAEVRESLTNGHLYDVVFNYLGQLDHVVSEGGGLGGAPESVGAQVSESNELENKLWIDSRVSGGELVMEWSYAADLYDASTIERLSQQYLAALEEMIDHCLKQDRRYYTASDYGLGSDVGYRELETFLASCESDEIQDDLIL